MTKKITKGIYHIVCQITGDFYVGSAWGKGGIQTRNKNELRALRNDKWLCKGKSQRTHIQEAWNKYGEDNFSWIIVDECHSNYTRIQILAIEQQHLDFFWYSNVLYNTSKIANGGSQEHTDESKLKISKALIGKKKQPFTSEHCINIGVSARGRTPWNKGLTKETDTRVCVKPFSLEHRAKLSSWQLGRKMKVPAWNKGLTKETDTRVASYGETRKRNNQQNMKEDK